MKGSFGGMRYDKKKREMVQAEHWWELLIRVRDTRDGPGQPKAIFLNAAIALREAPDWKGVLAFDQFALNVTTKKPAPHQDRAGETWTDYDDQRTMQWLQRNGILVNSKVTGEAVQMVAQENPFHPVHDYLKSLEWDGKPRLGTWLIDYLGAADSPFVRAIGPRWLISAVARIFEPGCQVDHTLLLEGDQGIRKSSALHTLAGERYFADHLSDLGSKDSRLELHGKWIIELEELDRVRRGDLPRIKAFLTARSDHFRAPYGRRTEDVPRGCVFAGSVNDDSPLTDETGNRRFWPVKCGSIKLDTLARDRDQLWAEAHERYRAGDKWWLETAGLDALAQAEQEQRYEPGIWDEVILEWLDNPRQAYDNDGPNQLPIEPFHSSPGKVAITDILLHAIHKPLDRLTQADRNQVARCLTHAGWIRKQDRSRGPLRGKWFYVRRQQLSLYEGEPQ